MDSIDISASQRRRFATASHRTSCRSLFPPIQLLKSVSGHHRADSLPPEVAPCTGPTSGNFGMLDVWWFGAGDPYDTLGEGCPSKPPFTKRSPQNLAIGVDHPITTWPDTDDDPTTYDGPSVGTNLPNNHPGAESCESAANDVIPYVVKTETGNTMIVLHEGFFGDGPFGTTATTPRVDSASLAHFCIDLQRAGPPLVRDRLGQLHGRQSRAVGVPGSVQDRSYEPMSHQRIHGARARRTGAPLAGRELTDQMELCLTRPDPKHRSSSTTSSSLPVSLSCPQLNYATGAQAGTEWWAIMEMMPVYVQNTWFLCGTPTADCLFEPTGFSLAAGGREKRLLQSRRRLGISVPPQEGRLQHAEDDRRGRRIGFRHRPELAHR